MAEFWFDSRTGDILVGRDAAAPRLDEAGPDIYPLPELVAARELPIDVSSYDRLHHSHFSRQDLITMGAWTLRLVELGHGEQQPLMRRHWDRMYLLGIAPNFKSQPYFRSMGELRKELGQKRGLDYGCYDEWTRSDWMDYAKEVRDNAGRKPTKEDYAAADGPGLGIIRENFGTTGNLNELIGYPNFRRMKPDEYVEWGAKTAERVGLDAFNYFWLEDAAKDDEAPSEAPIRRHFGTWTRFRKLVEARISERGARLAPYREKARNGDLPTDWAIETDDMLASTVARYELAHTVLSKYDSSDLIAQRIARHKQVDIYEQLKQVRPEITLEELQREALQLGVYDTIWSLNEKVV
jgi:hypothetical protein